MRATTLIFALSLTVIANLSLAQNNTRLTAYIKSFAVVQDSVENDILQLNSTYESQNSARLMLDSVGSTFAWQLHYEILPLFKSRSPVLNNQTLSRPGDNYRFSDISSELADKNSKHPVYQNLDRFNLQIKLQAGDLTIGRQTITFGSARFINPSDIFLPFDVRTFNQEYRFGIDAIRFERPVGELGELDSGIILGDGGRKENSAAYLNLRTHFSGIDFIITITRFSQQNLFATGIETSLGNAGFWFEAAKVSGDTDYLRISSGLDYAFSESTFGMLEYHYNEASLGNPETYLQQFLSTPYQKGGVFLLGKNYILASISLITSPLWNIGTSIIFNLNDDSSYTSVKAEYNLREDMYLDFGFYYFSGDDLQASPAPPYFQLQSEFGSNPNLAFFAMRYYF